MEINKDKVIAFDRQEAYRSDVKLDTMADRRAYLDQLANKKEMVASKILSTYIGTDKEAEKINEAIDKSIENEDMIVIEEVTKKKESWFSRKRKKKSNETLVTKEKYDEIIQKRKVANKLCEGSILTEVDALLQDERRGLKFEFSAAEKNYLSSIIEKKPEVYKKYKTAIDKLTKEFGELCTVNDSLRDTLRAVEFLQNNDISTASITGNGSDLDLEVRFAVMKSLKNKTEKEIALVNEKMVDTVQYMDYLFNDRPLSITALKKYQFSELPLPSMDEVKNKVKISEDDIKSRDEEKKQVFSAVISKYKGDNFVLASSVEFAKNYVLMDASGLEEAQEHNKELIDSLLLLKKAEMDTAADNALATEINLYEGRMGLVKGYEDFCNRIARIDVNFLLSMDDTLLPGYAPTLERIVKEAALWDEYNKKYDLSSELKITIENNTQIFESNDRKDLRQTKISMIETLYEKCNLMNYINADNCGAVFDSADIKKKYKRVHELNELLGAFNEIHNAELDKIARQINGDRYKPDYKYTLVEGLSDGLNWIDDVYATSGGKTLTEMRMYNRLTKKNYTMAGQDTEATNALLEQFMRTHYLFADIRGMKDIPKNMFQDMLLDISAGYNMEQKTDENAALVDRARERNEKGIKLFLNILGGHMNYLEKKYGYLPPAAELMTDMKLKQEFEFDSSFSQLAGYLVEFAKQIENGKPLINLDMDNPVEARIYHQIMYYSMVFKTYYSYKISWQNRAYNVKNFGELEDICDEHIARVKNLKEVPAIENSLDYLVNHPMQDIEIKPDEENEKKVEKSIAKISKLHEGFGKLSEIEKRDIESATRNLDDKQITDYIDKYIEDGTKLSQCKDYAEISRLRAKEDERRVHAFGEDKVKTKYDKDVTGFVELDLKTVIDTHKENSEGEKIISLVPASYLLDDLYGMEVKTDVNELYAAFLRSDWTQSEEKYDVATATYAVDADGNALQVSAGEKTAQKRKAEFCAFMREISDGGFSPKDAQIAVGSQYIKKINVTHFSVEQITHLIENCNKETVMEFLEPFFAFDVKSLLIKYNFIDEDGNILMDAYTRTLAAPKLFLEMSKMTRIKQFCEKFVLHRDFWKNDAEAKIKFDKAVFDIDILNTLKDVLTKDNYPQGFEEFVVRLYDDYGKSLELYEHYDEITNIGISVTGKKVKKIVNGKKVNAYEPAPDPSVPVFDKKSIEDAKVIEQTIEELDKFSLLAGNRKRLIGLEGYEELKTYGREDLLFFAKKAAYADLFNNFLYANLVDKTKAPEERNKLLKGAILYDYQISRMKENADKYKAIFNSLSMILGDSIKSYRMARAKLVLKDTDPTWYYLQMKDEYEKILGI